MALDKQAWISAKIKKIMDEGSAKDSSQAAAMAESMWEEMQKKSANKEMELAQAEVNYTPVSTQAGKACAGCRWFEPANSWGDGEDRIASCHLVNSYPQSIQPTGYCDRYEAFPAPQPMTQTPMPVVIVDPGEDMLDSGMAELGAKSEARLVDRLIAAVRSLGRKEASDEATAFKVAGNHWVATWSNNLEDRDGEIFTAKAIDDFVARVDMGIVPPPELWVWHIPGTRIGQAEWVDRHGHFLMAMGTFDATPAGEKARDYYHKHAGNKSLSHGFTFPTNQFDGKHYHQFNTFEISLLPRGAEANLYTSLEGVKEMAKVISEAKKAELFAAFGEDIGARILAAEDAKGKALDELGISSKDFVPSSDSGTATNAEAVATANKAFTALVPELMEGSAEAVIAANEAVTQVKAVQADNKALRAELAEIRAELKLKPKSVTQGGGAVLDPVKGAEVYAEVAKQFTKRDEFWGTTVEEAPPAGS